MLEAGLGDIFEQVQKSWHGLVRRFESPQRAQVLPITIYYLVCLAEASFEITILFRTSERPTQAEVFQDLREIKQQRHLLTDGCQFQWHEFRPPQRPRKPLMYSLDAQPYSLCVLSFEARSSLSCWLLPRSSLLVTVSAGTN